MSGDPPLIARIYKRLVGLYPKSFRELLHESMEQTFIDLYNARPGAFAIMRTFVGTLASVAYENLLDTRRNIFMKSVTANIAVAALIGFASILPFAILEYVNTRGFTSLGFPAALFAFLWLLVFTFVLMLTPTIRSLRFGDGIFAHPVSLVLRTLAMIVIGMVWLGVVSDQMPCFMGIPNCD